MVSHDKALLLKTKLTVSLNMEKVGSIQLDVLSLLTSIHVSGRYFACDQRRKVTINFIQL